MPSEIWPEKDFGYPKSVNKLKRIEAVVVETVIKSSPSEESALVSCQYTQLNGKCDYALPISCYIMFLNAAIQGKKKDTRSGIHCCICRDSDFYLQSYPLWADRSLDYWRRESEQAATPLVGSVPLLASSFPFRSLGMQKLTCLPQAALHLLCFPLGFCPSSPEFCHSNLVLWSQSTSEDCMLVLILDCLSLSFF